MYGGRLALALAWTLLAAAVPAAVALAEVTVVDAGGRSVTIADASRILCIGGDVTEIAYALGAGHRITAVDTTSQYPPEALTQKQSVGYMRALSSEGVMSVGATLVLASVQAGPPEVVRTLKATSVPYVEVPAEFSPEGVARKIRLIAKAIGAESAGERVARQTLASFARLAELRARIKRPVRALFVLTVQGGRIMVGGKDTSADAILRLAGAHNAADGINGFRPIGEEAVLELAPQVIVGMRRVGASAPHDLSGLLSMKGVQATPAGAAGRLVLLDGTYLTSFGPRAPEAARDLMRAFYPDLAGARK